MFSSLFHSSPSDLYVFSSRLLKHFFPRLEASTTTSDLTKRCDVTGGGGGAMCCSFLLPRSYLAFAPRERGRLSGGGSLQPGTIAHAVRAPAGPHMCSQSKACDHCSKITVNQRQMHNPPPTPTPAGASACKAAHTCLITHDREVPSLLGT